MFSFCMTLEQSEFQQLTEVLIELVDRYRGNPAVLGAILAEFHDIYKKIPIYPSIVAMCLGKVVAAAKVDEIQKEEEIAVTLDDGRTISGKVVENNEKEIKLAEAHRTTFLPLTEKVSIEKSKIEDVRKLVREILAKEWPTLNFKEG